MTTAHFDPDIGKIVLKSDDVTTKALLEYRRKKTVWNPWIKGWRETEIIDKLYDNPRRIGPNTMGIWTFEISRGWAAFIAQVFRNKLSREDYKEILSCIYANSYRTMPFPNLRDYQNTDILHMLKYRFGLATLNTGYGKSELIVTLAHYFYKDLGEPTLVVAPSIKARDELIKRYRMRFNESLPIGWDGDLGIVITAGILQRKVIKDSKLAKIEKIKLKKFKNILVDETEYCVNDGGCWLFDIVSTTAERMYGFSGSADKFNGECISFSNGINGTVMDNCKVVKYFGPSLVHRQPVSNKVNLIAVKTSALDLIEFGENEIFDDENVYAQINSALWTNPGVVSVIEKIIKKYPKLYIPINNLETIINYWVECWKGKFSILVIRHGGYYYYDKSGNMTIVDLEGAVDLMRENQVDVIPSTSSGFRALDFPGLQNMLMVAGKNAGVVLQTVGRTARMPEMNILYLSPKHYKIIPIYTKSNRHRLDMLKKYYKYSEINEIKIEEEDL